MTQRPTDGRRGVGRRAAVTVLAALTVLAGALSSVVLTSSAAPLPVAAASPGGAAAVLASPAGAAASPADVPADPPAGPSASLASVPPATTQAVTVEAPSPASTTGTLSTWQRSPGAAWARVLGPVAVQLGTGGTGAPSETDDRTPEGTFGLTRAFGRAPDPGSGLPYAQVGTSDWWVSDTASAAYNTHQVCAPGSCPFDESRGENLGAAGPDYDDAVVIDANTDPVVPGGGSAYFLHVGDVPTAGCVATDRADVVAVLRWLTPSAHPVIAISG